jgi:branched-chain amino acid transport system substrate-binding protein
MKQANFASVRGPFKYGNNHFPIQNFYLQEAVATSDSGYTLKTVTTALTAHQDRYHDKCPMK